MVRTYSELSKLELFHERFAYLELRGTVGEQTFGYERHLNQKFYTSREWKLARHYAIVRDNGRDLGVDGHEIYEKILIHHMNPISIQDIIDGNMDILDPEFLITTTLNTHNAIHYGDASLLPNMFVERTHGDTKLW